MRKNKIFLCLLLVFIMSFASFGGCKTPGNTSTGDKPGQDQSGDNESVVTYSGELAVNTEALKQFKKTYNENHSFSYKTTETYMVKNGKTSYKVVVPEVETQSMSYAKSELSRFFK